MNSLEINRDQILITIGGTAVFLGTITAIAILSFHLPLITVHWNFYHLLEGLSLGVLISGLSLGLHRSVSIFRHSADANLHTVVAPLAYQDLVWLGLLPGLSEELLFRGVLLPTIGLNWLGIILSSLIFGILHLSHPRHYIYALWAVLVGISFAFVTIISHNLLVSIVAHTTTNILSAWLWKSKIYQPDPQT